MTRLPANERMFKRAVVFSAVFHALLFTVIAISPSMTKPVQKGMIHYVSLGGFPGQGGAGGTGGSGGRGSGGTGGAGAEGGGPASGQERDAPGPGPAFEGQARGQAVHDIPCRQAKKGQEGPGRKEGRDHQASAEPAGRPGGQGGRNRLHHGRRVRRVGAQDRARRRARRGWIGGFGPGYGDQIGLSGFPYQYYLQIISDRVSSSWFTSLVDPGISGTFFATVYFKILRNGQVVDLKVKESSGIQSLDMSAQRAIQISAPFPPLPSDYEGDYLGIHLIFEHSK